MFRFKKTNFRFAKIVTWPKFGKPLSRRNFSIKFVSKLKNMNTLIIYIFEIESEKKAKKKKTLCLNMAAKISFLTLHNNIYLC